MQVVEHIEMSERAAFIILYLEAMLGHGMDVDSFNYIELM